MRRLRILRAQVFETLVIRVERAISYGSNRQVCALGIDPSTGKSRQLSIGGVNGGSKRFDLTIDSVDTMRPGDVFLHVANGDLVQLISGDIDEENSIVVTNECNLRCLMCPQRALDHQDHHNINLCALRLGPDGLKSIGLTGGEPTLPRTRFLEIIRTCRKRFPSAVLSVLTNGVLLSDEAYVAEIVAEVPDRVLFHIPLYADNQILHDAIVGGPGFFRTIRGIYNLYSHSVAVEVRLVIMKQNVARLESTADYIGRMMPFASHVAFMGIELEGAAGRYEEFVWPEPSEYMATLERSVTRLERQGLSVSVFNLPLCLLSPQLRRFSRKAISSWKVAFAGCCKHCVAQAACGGFFESTRHRYSRLVSPIVEEA